MFAIVEIAGKQYKVQKGQTVLVDHLGDTDKKSQISKVFLVWDEKNLHLGKPYIEKAKVEYEVIEKTLKAKKVQIVKHKAKKRYRRKIGFRPTCTKIKILDIKI